VTPRRVFSLLAAALVAAACSDAGTRLAGPRRTFAAAASGAGITLDQTSGILPDGMAWPQGGTHIGKDFPTNPHLGDAIVASFFWKGTTNTITTVTDHFCDVNSTPIGNTYTLVDYVTAGGYSMATYVATNVQGFPDPATTADQKLCVHAIFSDSFTEGGMILSAYQGVATVTASALGAHHSATGLGSTTTVADPGAIAIGAGALAYAVTMSSGVVGTDPPSGFTNVDEVADNSIKADAEYDIVPTAGSVDPRWNWYFTSSQAWLATVLALNPASGGSTNQPPTAAFSSSCGGLTCNFTNSSSDPDGTIASNSWTFGDSATSTAQSPSHTYATAGTYTVTLTVTDNQGATSSTSQSVTVTAPNQPPVAAFSSSCSGDTCSFTSTSSDPDGSISAYNWSFGDGGTSTAQNPSHAYAVGGTYAVTLTVADNLGATNSVSQSVTVNRPPVAAFTSSCTALTCSLTSTSSDPDGSIASYSWTFGDGSTSTAQNPSHSYSTGGTYTVTLTVTDNQGATNSVSYSVIANTPPSVNAGPDETVPVGVLYTLNWSFSDPDNGPWTYTINWGDGSYSIGSVSSPGSFSAGHAYFGVLTTRTITVTVTDGRGASGSDTKVITEIL
jgi:PKD repeat protein